MSKCDTCKYETDGVPDCVIDGICPEDVKNEDKKGRNKNSK